jgi:hypothetical protein
MKQVAKISSVNKQPHGVVHPSLHPAEQRKNVEQAAQHNRDMTRIEKLHLRGQQK